MFNDDDFDKSLRRTNRFIMVYIALSGIVSIGIVCFLGWVAVKLLQHFGVL